MGDIAIKCARDLPDSIKSAIETLLGRSLSDGEEITVMALQPHPAPSGERRQAAAAKLKQVLDRLAAKATDVPEEDFEAAVDEAITHVRPRPR